MKKNVGNRMTVNQLQNHLNDIIEKGFGESAFWLGEYFATNENVDIDYKENDVWKKHETDLPYSCDEDSVGFSAIHIQDYNDLLEPTEEREIAIEQGKKQKDLWQVQGYVDYLFKEMSDRYVPSETVVNKLNEIKNNLTTENYKELVTELDIISGNIQNTSVKMDKMEVYIDYLLEESGDYYKEKLLLLKNTLCEDNFELTKQECNRIADLLNKYNGK